MGVFLGILFIKTVKINLTLKKFLDNNQKLTLISDD
jgi:hypothetical protein